MEKRCLQCGGSMEGKRPHAKYCSRTCKTAANDQRRKADGREALRFEAWVRLDIESGRRAARPRRPGAPRDSQYYRDRYIRKREHRLAVSHEYYQNHAEERRAYSRKWRRENREKRRVQHANRRARKYGNPGYIPITVKDWHDALRIAGHACIYCGATGVPLVMDHIIPLARGGRHAPANIAPACHPCNSEKNDHLVSEWRHGRLPPLRR